MKLRLLAKYNLSISALILAVSAVVALTLDYQFQQTVREMASAGMEALEGTIFKEALADGTELISVLSANAAAPLAVGDANAVRDVLSTGLRMRHVRYILATDRKGRTVRVGVAEGVAPIALATLSPSPESITEDGMLIITAPAFYQTSMVGALRLGLSRESIKTRRGDLESSLARVQESGDRARRVVLVTVLALLLPAGMLLGSVMARRLSRPVRTLAHNLRNFVPGDVSGEPLSIRGADEISDLAAAFALMRESLGKTTVSRDFLRMIIDSLNEGLIVTGADGDIHLANRATGEMFGYRPDELTGKQFTRLMAQPQKFAGIDSEIRVAECGFLHREGHEIPVMVSRSIVTTGEVTEHVYVISNITERKRLEEELGIYRGNLEQLVLVRTRELTAAIHELESFSYSVSHDLHAPLRAINGFGAALQEDYYQQLDETGRNYLQRIRGATVRMGQLIDGLLALTRVARSEIQKDAIDLSSIASEVAAELAANEPRRQVTFRIAPGVKVHGDPSHLRLLLQNLFGNAWKFSAKQGSALIEFGQMEIEGNLACFVRDNGEGFDPVLAHGLFQPFHRLHDEEFPGTGIGLATVQRIVRRHGGKVWAESMPGTGATFYFALPEPGAQVEESRVSALTPLSNNVSSQRPSATAWRKI